MRSKSRKDALLTSSKTKCTHVRCVMTMWRAITWMGSAAITSFARRALRSTWHRWWERARQWLSDACSMGAMRGSRLRLSGSTAMMNCSKFLKQSTRKSLLENHLNWNGAPPLTVWASSSGLGAAASAESSAKNVATRNVSAVDSAITKASAQVVMTQASMQHWAGTCWSQSVQVAKHQLRKMARVTTWNALVATLISAGFAVRSSKATATKSKEAHIRSHSFSDVMNWSVIQRQLGSVWW